ncbi:hypothetical protein DRO58_07980 [Candidatus Bathyarchaeota archaeon]|nr:MAG: hypothetical protein DRO58_07980 [Candidatus Bathyarchaeota archaeon]
MFLLKSENLIDRFLRVAGELVSRITSLDGVVGVVFLGGLARGFLDRFSDLDIDVFLRERDERLRRRIYDLGSEVESRYGIKVDLEVHFLEEFERRRWSEADRWLYSNAKIVFDPEGRVRKILERKLNQPEEFWLNRMAMCTEYLKRYCCPLGEDAGTVAEAWVERGDLLAAHYCVNYMVDLLLTVLYTLNREFLPAPKWRIFYSYKLRLKPRGYRKLIEEAIKVENLSREELERRLRAVRRLWRWVVKTIREETGLTLEDLSKRYVETIGSL